MYLMSITTDVCVGVWESPESTIFYNTLMNSVVSFFLHFRPDSQSSLERILLGDSSSLESHEKPKVWQVREAIYADKTMLSSYYVGWICFVGQLTFSIQHFTPVINSPSEFCAVKLDPDFKLSTKDTQNGFYVPYFSRLRRTDTWGNGYIKYICPRIMILIFWLWFKSLGTP